MESQDKFKNKNVKLRLDKKRLINSFKYSFAGIKQAFLDEQNLKIHFLVALLVIIFGFVFKISYLEWIICFILIGLVLMAEFFNTSIEYLVDLVSPSYNILAKATKDTASAGVLIMALISFIIGCLIFIPKILNFVGGLL